MQQRMAKVNHCRRAGVGRWRWVPAKLLLTTVALARAPQAVNGPRGSTKAAEAVTFETISIRLADSREDFQQRLLPDGYLLRSGSLRRLIELAYAPAELPAREQDGAGPPWVRSEGVDVTARVADQDVAMWQRTTAHSFSSPALQLALRAMLAERYKLQAHLVREMVDGFALVKDPAAPMAQLMPSDPSGVQPVDSSSGTLVKLNVLEDGVVQFHNQPMAELASFLSGLSAFKIEDRTCLRGQYDFAIRDMEPAHESEEDRDVYRLPQARWDLKPLGLKLVRSKVHAMSVRIDAVEHFSPN